MRSPTTTEENTNLLPGPDGKPSYVPRVNYNTGLLGWMAKGSLANVGQKLDASATPISAFAPGRK